MLTDLTDRYPGRSAAVIALLFTVVPGAFILASEALFPASDSDISINIVFVYALILQLILWLKVERPILILLPFLISLVSFIAAEIIYTLSESAAAPGTGPSALIFLFSSALIVVFGPVAAASIGALICYGLIVVVRKIRECISGL